jgi:hypothetical protein
VIRERIVHVQPPAPPPPPATLTAEPPVVESLEVDQGAGTILTIPGEAGENPTTVIWVSRDDVEGPI